MKNKSFGRAAFIFSVLAGFLIAAASPAWAQLTTAAATGSSTAAASKPTDPLGRDTPQSMASHFLSALAAEDYKAAADYLDLSSLPKSKQGNGVEIAHELQFLLDQSGSIHLRKLSNQPAGQLDDGLPADREDIGTIKTDENETVDIMARRVDQTATGGGQIWLIAPETVAKIPDLMSEVSISHLNQILPYPMIKQTLLGIPVGHWLALLALAPLSYLVIYLITALINYIVRRAHDMWRRKYETGLLEAFTPPVRLFLTAALFIFVAHFLGVSIIARQYFGRGAIIIAWVSVAWLGQRVVDVFASVGRDKLSKLGHIDAISALMFFRRSIKIIMIGLALMAILDTLGVNVSAALAALGIGGIAVALGAQKTVENLIGGVSLILDRPIRIGDFCRFGTLMGTVEDIGMRSIRIRTPDRTVVTVPNGEFATLQIENFNKKEKLYFHPFIALRYDVTTQQIRAILDGIRELVKKEPTAEQPGSYVNFVGITDRGSPNIEISVYILTTDYDEFRRVTEKFLLDMMDIIKANNTALAVPYNAPAPVVIVEEDGKPQK